MANTIEQAVPDFYTYPPVGEDDWQYAFATGEVRALETQMLTRGAFLDMANAENFEQAADLLGAGEYALPSGRKDIAELENVLRLGRSQTRSFFAGLMIDKQIVELLKARDDFANMRLALRRKLMGKPIGVDYSDDGNVAAESLEKIFEEENYSPLPLYMQEAIERAVLAYYQNKDVRQIDYALDAAEAEYKLQTACDLKSIFLIELFRMQVDLTNIRTMLRIKFTESEQRNVFLDGGYVGHERFRHALDVGLEAIAPLFFGTPYYNVVEPGVAYFTTNRSFLKIEQHCDEHVLGFLKTTSQITAGPQPVIAYLLMKENEIRSVRLVLTAKKNALATELILDRLVA